MEVVENIEKGKTEENKLEFRRKPQKVTIEFTDGTKTRQKIKKKRK
jgi:hypothetical protein